MFLVKKNLNHIEADPKWPNQLNKPKDNMNE
jgi:hypothetical protein